MSTLLQQLLDAFGAHHGDEFSGELLVELALALVGDHFTALQFGNFAGIHHHEGFEIKHALQFTQRDVEQVADAAGQPFEEPDVRAGAGELDMAEALAAHARQRHFDAALVANHAAVLHALVLAAQALPVGDGTEDPGAEQAVALRLEGPVVDRFRLGDFAMRPAPDFFRRGETDPDGIEVGDQICSIVGRGTIHEISYMTSCGSRRNPVSSGFGCFSAICFLPSAFCLLHN